MWLCDKCESVNDDSQDKCVVCGKERRLESKNTDNNKNQVMFKNPFSFNGRIRRSEMWITSIISGVVTGIIQLFAGSGSGGLAVIAIIIYIALAWFSLAQGAKRCHDRGNPGWYQILPFYFLWMLFGDSEPGTNRFGPCPK